MIFKKLRERIRVWWHAAPLATVSEEQAHALEIERLDREEPGWDRDARLARCQYGLAAGTPRGDLVRIYGEELVREAIERTGNF